MQQARAQLMGKNIDRRKSHRVGHQSAGDRDRQVGAQQHRAGSTERNLREWNNQAEKTPMAAPIATPRRLKCQQALMHQARAQPAQPAIIADAFPLGIKRFKRGCNKYPLHAAARPIAAAAIFPPRPQKNLASANPRISVHEATSSAVCETISCIAAHSQQQLQCRSE